MSCPCRFSRLQNGEIALFYLRKNSAEDCIPMVRFSKDEAKTWSDPLPCITDKKGYFVLNNDRVTQAQQRQTFVCGRPSPGARKSPAQTILADCSAIIRMIMAVAGSPGQEEVANPDNVMTQEPGLIELKDGNIMMFIRTDAGVQYLSFSGDKRRDLEPGEKSDIKSPLSPASIERILPQVIWSWSGIITEGEDPAMKGRRTPLTVTISKDEGKTWEKVKNIEDDPDGWYCYTAIHFTGKHVLLGHCAETALPEPVLLSLRSQG